MNKYVKNRHRFFFAVCRPIVRILALKFHFKTKTVKLQRDTNYLILSNHQSFLDPAFVALTIKRPIYFVTSDAVKSKLLYYCFGPLRKRKGFTDTACIRAMCQVAKEGGNVAVFPEGNRQWNDSQFHIDRAIVKLVRLLKLPLVVYNFHGGYGVQPRWANSTRKGKYTGEIKEIVSKEQIAAMSDDELYDKIVLGLKVIDSDSGQLYKSNKRAEYLERELFVCPKCGAQCALHSHASDIRCENCGLTVTYGENLRLTSPDPEFHFDKLVDWYQFQQQYVIDYDLEKTDVIFSDDNIKLYDKTDRKRLLVAQGRLTLTKDILSVGEFTIPTDQIFGGSTQDSDKMSFNAGNKAYIAIGTARFNGIKYLLFFNRVCKQIVEKGGDKYYGLSIDPSQR
ncbi:MAG: 1-acyl-sn-glycerol-3-phosphate acyltransferase [Clostridiales bacterium]|nr:1-acyl-sn-glycerol-3-phosphate acyltransferase [Clostridiales bacterium]